jgi:hypothetical protein
MTGKSLEAALAGLAEGFRDRAPVFRLLAPEREEVAQEARLLMAGIWPQFGDCSPMTTVGGVLTTFRLANDGSVNLFPSGAIEGAMSSVASREPIATDERKADRTKHIARLSKVAHAIAKGRIAADEELKLETVWENKGQCVTVRGERKTPVALLGMVAGFRRYIRGIPVLGRASVHVGVGGNGETTRWGIDWRRREAKECAETTVVSAEEGAERVMSEMWWRRPDKPFTTEDFEPVVFRFGYLAHARRAEQSMLQPAWVAVLKPRKGFSMGHVVAVPASPRAFEPISRPARVPRMAVTGT